jgi:hypothetical protein
MLINVSRSVARAENPGLAAAQLRDEILSIKYLQHPRRI